jgi:hypothetical protein
MNELPPELPAEVRRLIENQNRRVLNFKFIVAMYAVAMAFLTFALHSGFNPLLRPAVILLCAVGAVALFLRYQAGGNRLPFLNPRGAPPSSSPEVENDLKDVPPEPLADPDVQKLRDWARAQGASLKVTGHAEFSGVEAQRQQTVKTVASLGAPGASQAESIEPTAELAPDLAASTDIQKLSEYVESHGAMPAGPEMLKTLGSPVSIEVVSVLSRIVTWAASVVIFAALAAAAVAYWTLTSGPKSH